MADEQKPLGAWAWLAVIAGALFWFLRRKKPKPNGNGGIVYPTLEYRMRASVYGLRTHVWHLLYGHTAERALDQLKAAGLTSAGRILLFRPGQNWRLIPYKRGADEKYHVRRDDVLWDDDHKKLVRDYLELCKRRGLLVEVDAFDQGLENNWDSYPLSAAQSNSGLKGWRDLFDLRNFDITKLWLERIRDICLPDYASIIEFMPMNETFNTTLCRAWEIEALKYAKELGFERRVSSLDNEEYADRCLRDKLTYAHQWHGIEDAEDIKKTGPQHIADTDGAEDKDRLPFRDIAREAIRSQTHIYFMAAPEVVDEKYPQHIVDALGEEMKWWWGQHPK